MNGMKIAIIVIITLGIIGAATIIIAGIKPKMHKTIKLENVIFKRSTK